MERVRILAGFSGNPMQIWRLPSFEAVRGQKSLVSRSWTIGGTTFNLLDGFQQLSSNIDCRGLVTVSATLEDERTMLAQITTQRGYDCRFFPCRRATSTAVVIQEEDGVTTILGDKPEYETMPDEEVGEEIERFQPDVVIASGVVPQDVPLARSLFLNSLGHTKRIFNPRRELILGDRAAFIRLATISHLLVINDVEMAAILGRERWTYDPDRALQAVDDLRQVEALGVREIIVTCNSHGAVYFSGAQAHHQPAIDCGPVYETTGAGDSFLAGFLTATFERMHIQAALHFASVVAGIKVARREPGMPTRHEVNAVLGTLQG